MKFFFRLKGYTLAEIAVVLAIMILIYASVAMSSHYLFPKRAEAESRQIMADLIWARDRASSNQLNSCFVFIDQSAVNSNYTYTIYNGTCGALGAPISNVSLVSFICSSDINAAAMGSNTASCPFNITVYNQSLSPNNIAGSFGFPSCVTAGNMSIGVTFMNATTKIIRLFNATGFVRKEITNNN
jgi:tryptophan-rich sensory protein